MRRLFHVAALLVALALPAAALASTAEGDCPCCPACPPG